MRLAVRGDPVRLRQILTNLISNAVKFTERGAITLGVVRRGETKTHHELRFEVRDTGIGIARENLGNLFRAFAQADASTTRLYGGTGLGLVICKRIVDLMGGTIGVDSEAGRGTTFWFEIPLLKAVGDIQEARADLHGSRALLLSSDASHRLRLQQAATTWGLQLALADSTQDALGQLRTALARGGNWTIDLLMVDLNSVRATMIALHRNLRNSPEFDSLPVAYMKGADEPPAEISADSNALVVARTMGAPELRSAINSFLSRKSARATETPISALFPEPLPEDGSVAPAAPPQAQRQGPAGRGQPGQSEGRAKPDQDPRSRMRDRRQRSTGVGADGQGRTGRGADGLPDAGQGRLQRNHASGERMKPPTSSSACRSLP